MNFSRLLRLWPWLAAISSGLLYRLCFAPFDEAWLCWIALTPLLAAIWFSGANSRRRSLRDLSLGYIAGVHIFRQRLLLADHRHRPGYDPGRIVHGVLPRDLELALRQAPPLRRENPGRLPDSKR